MKEFWETFRLSGAAMLAASAALALGSALMTAWQVLHWLSTARWVPLPIEAFLSVRPVTTWAGIQSLIDWYWGLPLSLVMLGFAAVFFFGAVSEASERKWGRR